MKNSRTIVTRSLLGIIVVLIFVFGMSIAVHAAPPVTVAPMENYCVVPPFISQNVPPLVMFIMGRDHKMYYEAYNDASDLNDDGQVDTTYDHSIEYYGYFDTRKCYRYDSSGTPTFRPVGPVNADGFCSAGSGNWNGNLLNWLTMSRIDVLKKVLYGGFRRRDDQSTTYLERAYIPQDAHSWGKEYTGRLCSNGDTYTNQCVANEDCESGFSCVDRSTSLTPLNAPVDPSTCTADPTPKVCAQTGADCSKDSSVCSGTPGDECVYTNTSNMLVVRYNSSATTDPFDHAGLVSSYEPANLLSYFTVTDFSDTSLNPNLDHDDTYNTLVVADFEVDAADAGDWYFAVDGDDAVEIAIDGFPVVGWYGLHAACGGVTCFPTFQQSGPVTMSAGWHRIVVRHFERTGVDGVIAYYKKSAADPYSVFGSPGLNVRAPQPGGSDPACPLKDRGFIETGDLADGTITSAARHLFCNTTLENPSNPPVMRYVTDRTERIWQWASKDQPVCNDPGTAGYPFGSVSPTDLEVRVEICVPGLLEDNCREYQQSPPLKPSGLMQKYGESLDRVCSLSFKSCNVNADCGGAPEVCIDAGQMFFGLITGSYTKNLSGGVVRWNIDAITHDIDNRNVGIIQNKGVIGTMNKLAVMGFDYASHSYPDTDSCGWITTRSLREGECRMWGNPIAEMMYESTRYFAGFANPTPDFAAGTADNGTDDMILGLPNWSDGDTGKKDPSEWEPPYEKFPRCAKPFMLVLSDINPSFDSDQLPGNFAFPRHDGTGGNTPSFSNSAGELANLNVTSEADLIGATEGLNGASVFLGETGSTFDSQCTAKTISTLGKSRGLCPEEPTKQGSFYSAAVAHYAKTALGDNYSSPTGDPLPNVTTYSIAFASPVPKINISNGTDEMTIVPVGTSVSGCLSTYTACASKCTLTYDASGKGLNISGCSSGAYCPSNQIVDFYVEEISSDKGRFRINFEDVEQGGDHDMDAIVMYEYCVGSACTPAVASNKVKITLNSNNASECIDQALGFVVSGSTSDGTYLPVKDGDVPNSSDSDTPSVVAGMNTTWTRTLTFSGAPSAKMIENPLWYAAKWGGFVDSDLPGTPGYKIPDKQDEWDEDRDGNPDTYFFVSNPLKLEEQIEKSFLDILRRASSGTAVSVLASGEERGANMLQAVFYPMKLYGKEGSDQTDILWTGRMQNLWFYLDPVLGSSNIREDTVKDNVLDLDADYVTKLFFDASENKTRASRCQDVDADGDCQPGTSPDVVQPTIDFEGLSNIWEVGEKLFLRDAGKYNNDPDARVILTNLGQGLPDDATLDAFDRSSMGITDKSSALNLTGLLQAVSDDEAAKLIDWIRGIPEAEEPFCSGDETRSCDTDADCAGGETCIDLRNRTATLSVCSVTADKFCTRDIDCPAGESCSGSATGTWKLGDIVSSTPRIVSRAPSNDYYNKYNDLTYKQFTETHSGNRPDINYKGRGLVFVGANDGMLHAIKLGVQERISDYWDKTRIEKISGTDLGKEVWAFIPKNVLPFLKYIAQKDYCHIYSVDATPYIVDASIGEGNSGYEQQPKTVDSWRTILIGSMRLGGGCKLLSGATDCTGKDCVNTPLSRVGYSSYFALDITETLAHPDDPLNYPPKLLWEFSNPSLGFSTTGPVVGKIAPKDSNGDPENTKNGWWFVVITSGPTGPIDPASHEFKGRSNQNMKIFVLDLAGNGNGNAKIKRIIDSGIPQSFGNTSFNSLADVDQRNNSKENYSDDVIYLGYVKPASTGTKVDWIDGGILRLATKEDTNVGNWPLPSTLIDGIGPITATPVKFAEDLGDKERFWVLFGSGRYFYKADDRDGRRSIYAITEPCYNSSVPFDFDPNCTVTLKRTDLDNATFNRVDPIRAYNSTSGFKGWYINLDCSSDDLACPSTPGPFPYNAERIITHPLPVARGKKALTYFTSFAPTGDLCGYSGMTYLWAVDILTGGPPDESLLFGKALIQVSTGEIKEINLKDAFVEKTVTVENPDGSKEERGRRSHGFKGVPPQGQGLSVIVMPEGLKEIIHLEER